MSDIKYWLIVTSYENFKLDREKLNFSYQGFAHWHRKKVQKMKPGHKVLYYIMGKQRFGAIATITGEYFHDETPIWHGDKEKWPARCSSKPDIILKDDELLDVKKFVDNFSFIKRNEVWFVYFQGSIKEIPEEDYKLVESEMRRIISERSPLPNGDKDEELDEEQYENAIKKLELESKSLHDRIGEMLQQIGLWMGYDTQVRHKITPDHAYELDVAWLIRKNPEIAIEIQISGNLTEAKDRLNQARKFNYRKVIIVLRDKDLNRFNKIMQHEPELRNWMEIWSIGAVLKMYKSGKKFFEYYKILRESTYKEKTMLTPIG